MNEAIPEIYTQTITTIEQAEAYIEALFENGHLYHFDDDARECGFEDSLAQVLNQRSEEMWELSKLTCWCQFTLPVALNQGEAE